MKVNKIVYSFNIVMLVLIFLAFCCVEGCIAGNDILEKRLNVLALKIDARDFSIDNLFVYQKALEDEKLSLFLSCFVLDYDGLGSLKTKMKKFFDDYEEIKVKINSLKLIIGILNESGEIKSDEIESFQESVNDTVYPEGRPDVIDVNFDKALFDLMSSLDDEAGLPHKEEDIRAIVEMDYEITSINKKTRETKHEYIKKQFILRKEQEPWMEGKGRGWRIESEKILR